MKIKNLLKYAAMAAVFSACGIASAQTILIEAEDFQFPADWVKSKLFKEEGLNCNTSTASPLTVVEIKDGGLYSVWANGIDYAENAPGSRSYKVVVDGKALPNPSGKHGKEGLCWEKLGELELTPGEKIIQLKRVGNYARCDAIIFTKDSAFNPNDGKFARSKITKTPINVEYKVTSDFPELAALTDIKNPKIVQIKNADYKLIFTQKKDEKGELCFERSAEVLKDGKWVKLAPFKDELLFMLYSKECKMNDGTYFVSWPKSNAKATAIINGKNVPIDLAPVNPYTVGVATALRPISVRIETPLKLVAEYSNGVQATFTLPEKGQAVRMDVSAEIRDAGYYSFGMKTFNEHPKNDIEASFLPTVYQGKRLMSDVKIITDKLASQPLAMLQVKDGGIAVVSGAVANPEFLPFEWSSLGCSRYGLSLASPQNFAQAAIFRPVLGGKDSLKKSGEKLEASWFLINIAGDWRDALAYANEKIFAGAALREPYDTSLSDAIANIAAYLKDGVHSGWSARHKARWNIEGEDLATLAAPLSEISVAVLTDDEEYYKNIALPSLEYTISRASVHFSTIIDTNDGYGKALYRLTVPSESRSGDYYASVDALLGRNNPWIYEFALDANGKPVRRGGAGTDWTYLFGYYLVNPTPELLGEIKTMCDKWIASSFDKKWSGDPNMVNFINVSLYPYWWYLPDLYEVTGDKKYLDFAEQGAFYSLSSLWSFPTPPAGEVVINEGDWVGGVTTEWWHGSERFRVGYDTQKAFLKILRAADSKAIKGGFIVPQKKVDAMKVSRIGMGIEQHSTYIGGSSNILMPSWAPEMLKVYQYTNRDIIMKYSRHTMVGRFANFLGYYFRDFTDIQHDPDYPVVGPDITSFYYHHAPCHFGQTLDYFMAQIEIASNNKIKFPHLRQQGYVWFTDRIYGIPGKVFDEENCRPLIDKAAVRPDSAKVSTLVARGKNSIWVILYNDTGKPVNSIIKLDAVAHAMRGAKTQNAVELYDAKGVKQTKSYAFNSDMDVKIPALGLVALRVPAEDYDSYIANKPLPKEGSHFVQKGIAAGWGDLHVFRIRGPFGKDSVYAILTGGFEKKDSSISLSVNGAAVKTSQYPFEATIYPLSQDEDLTVSVSVVESGKVVGKAENIVLKK